MTQDTLTSHEFFRIIKGDYIGDDNYKHYYQDDAIEITNKKIQAENEIIIFSGKKIVIRECDFIVDSDVLMIKLCSKKAIEFNKCKFPSTGVITDGLELEGHRIEELSFKECNFHELLMILQSSFDSLNVLHPKCKSVAIHYVSSNILKIDSRFNEKEKNDIEDNITLKDVKISGSDEVIDTLHLELNRVDIDVSDLNINEINLSLIVGLNNDISFRQLKTQKLQILKIFNKGVIIFSNLFVQDSNTSTLVVKESYLGDCTFNSVALENFNNVDIQHTSLSSLKLIDSKFPVKSIERKSKNLYRIFNDLYTISKNKSDKEGEIEYYRASKKHLLSSLYKQIQETQHLKKYLATLLIGSIIISISIIILQKLYHLLDLIQAIVASFIVLISSFLVGFSFFIGKGASIITLFTSKVYSNFGTSFPQAILSTFFVSGLFFFLMLFFSRLDLDINTINYYIQYLNPIHKLDFMDTKTYFYSKQFGFVLFDYVGRIFISIGIFETIRSFRKYV